MSRLLSNKSRLIMMVTFLLIGSLPFTASAGDGGKAVAIIVNSKVAASSVSMAELRKIWVGDQASWSGGAKVVLLNRPTGSHERDVLLKKVCQMSDSQYKQYWIAKVFRQEAQGEPKVISSPDAVASTPGGISVVDADKVPSGVKVLKVDGKGPEDKGYPVE